MRSWRLEKDNEMSRVATKEEGGRGVGANAPGGGVGIFAWRMKKRRLRSLTLKLTVSEYDRVRRWGPSLSFYHPSPGGGGSSEEEAMGRRLTFLQSPCLKRRSLSADDQKEVRKFGMGQDAPGIWGRRGNNLPPLMAARGKDNKNKTTQSRSTQRKREVNRVSPRRPPLGSQANSWEKKTRQKIEIEYAKNIS